jgi:AI-2 transport protein TqsA
MPNNQLINLTCGAVLVALIGCLLVIGKAILLPILVAVFSMYIMVAATETLQHLPVLGRLPEVILRLFSLAVFTVVLLALATIVSATIREIAAVAPVYQANLEVLFEGAAARLGLDTNDLWDEVQAATVDQIDLQRFVLGLLGGFTSVGMTIFLTAVYAGFLFGERATFGQKVSAAFPDEGQAEQILDTINKINGQVRDYITVKTLINVILGVVSYAILRFIGVDFALFWALVIALLNYIPYVGSYIGVAFPVLLSVAQFADLGKTIVLLALLTAVQVMVGNYLEPRMIGRQLNLSPFVVLVSLSIWATLWGVPGAILAVPMTSILVITLSSFVRTRPMAILLANSVDDLTTPQRQ